MGCWAEGRGFQLYLFGTNAGLQVTRLGSPSRKVKIFVLCMERIFNYKICPLKLRTWCSASITSIFVMSRFVVWQMTDVWGRLFGFALLSSLFSCFIFIQTCNSFGIKTFVFALNAECLGERLKELDCLLQQLPSVKAFFYHSIIFFIIAFYFFQKQFLY